MDKLRVSDRVRAIAEQVAGEHDLELVQVETIGSVREPVIRIFIDKPGGVTHGDCSSVSRFVGSMLDADDFVSDDYTLEVSSPGLERELFELKHYERYAGSLAKLKVRQPIGNQRNFRGRIIGAENETIIFDDKTAGRVEIPFGVIAKANLEIDIEEELKRSEKVNSEE